MKILALVAATALAACEPAESRCPPVENEDGTTTSGCAIDACSEICRRLQACGVIEGCSEADFTACREDESRNTEAFRTWESCLAGASCEGFDECEHRCPVVPCGEGLACDAATAACQPAG